MRSLGVGADAQYSLQCLRQSRISLEGLLRVNLCINTSLLTFYRINSFTQMTVEIGFLNKTAVALAADSAMTILGTRHNSTGLEPHRD